VVVVEIEMNSRVHEVDLVIEMMVVVVVSLIVDSCYYYYFVNDYQVDERDQPGEAS